MNKDSLSTMLEMQKTIQENAYGYKFSDMTLEDRTKFIKEMSIHATQEIHEMLYELPHFKPWKDYSQMTQEHIDQQMGMAKEEFVDFMHFTLNMALALDMTAEDIFNGYSYKNQENYKRQVEGYTHDKSYRS